ncbi:hypothetical protein HDU97_009617 [Phlyctochytrium planicorne]|nr:hypothetical protein HDU97_009617 [Phlyctochytrium planicorne]
MANSTTLTQQCDAIPGPLTWVTSFDVYGVGDIPTRNGAGMEAKDGCECAAACVKNSRCTLFVYHPDPTQAFPCYLKETVDTNQNIFTIFKALPKIRINGSFSNNRFGPIYRDETTCLAECNRDIDCFYITIRPDGCQKEGGSSYEGSQVGFIQNPGAGFNGGGSTAAGTATRPVGKATSSTAVTVPTATSVTVNFQSPATASMSTTTVVSIGIASFVFLFLSILLAVFVFVRYRRRDSFRRLSKPNIMDFPSSNSGGSGRSGITNVNSSDTLPRLPSWRAENTFAQPSLPRAPTAVTTVTTVSDKSGSLWSRQTMSTSNWGHSEASSSPVPALYIPPPPKTPPSPEAIQQPAPALTMESETAPTIPTTATPSTPTLQRAPNTHPGYISPNNSATSESITVLKHTYTAPSRTTNSDISKWTVEDVSKSLQRSGVSPTIVDRLRDHRVDGVKMMTLNEQVLIGMGIEPFGTRCVVLMALSVIRGENQGGAGGEDLPQYE